MSILPPVWLVPGFLIPTTHSSLLAGIAEGIAQQKTESLWAIVGDAYYVCPYSSLCGFLSV
jgi:hypothetical protein